MSSPLLAVNVIFRTQDGIERRVSQILQDLLDGETNSTQIPQLTFGLLSEEQTWSSEDDVQNVQAVQAIPNFWNDWNG